MKKWRRWFEQHSPTHKWVAGSLQRVHGGALPTSTATADLLVRQDVAATDKIALGGPTA